MWPCKVDVVKLDMTINGLNSYFSKIYDMHLRVNFTTTTLICSKPQ